MGKLNLSPLIGWPGGQSREVKRLLPLAPKHSTYVEPFVGGGSFFFAKDPAKKDVIGDTNSWLIPFYRDVRDGKARACSGGIRYSPKTHKKALNKKKKTACDRIAIAALSFGSMNYKAFNKSPARNAGKTSKHIVFAKKFKRLEDYEEKLKRATLVKGGFAATMRKYDSSKTWHLLDPPWPSIDVTRHYEGKLTVTPEQVEKVARAMKGTVWVLYNDHADVKKAFCSKKKWTCYRMQTTALATGNKAGAKKSTKLLITNRKLPRRPKGVRELSGFSGLDIAVPGVAESSNPTITYLAGAAALVVSVAVSGGDLGKTLTAAVAAGLAAYTVKSLLTPDSRSKDPGFSPTEGLGNLEASCSAMKDAGITPNFCKDLPKLRGLCDEEARLKGLCDDHDQVVAAARAS